MTNLISNFVSSGKLAGSSSMILRRFFSAHVSSRRKSHYETLDVTANASKKEIRDAYIQKSKVDLSGHWSVRTHYHLIDIKLLEFISTRIVSILYPLQLYHPDNDPSDPSLHEKFVAIQEAYNVLSSYQKRREYDIPSTNFNQGTVHRSASNPRPGEEQYKQYEQYEQYEKKNTYYFRARYFSYVPSILFCSFWLSIVLYSVYVYFNSDITSPNEPPNSLQHDDKTKKERKERTEQLVESLERLKETQVEEQKKQPKGKHDDWIFDTRIMDVVLSNPDGKGK